MTPGQASYDLIIGKFADKLNAWKARLLSPAGRVVLIKSVLQALPVYYMATEKLPNKVLSAISVLTRKFYWGALEKKRYLAYISWEKITMPLELGGLAIRDLYVVNEALLMKALWKLATDADAQWVQLVKAKYLPRSGLWDSKRTYNCSVFWRSIMNLREKLWPMIQVKIGDGECCKVFGQPWVEGGVPLLPQNREARKIRVCELKDPNSGNWDVDKLIQLVGYSCCMKIVGEVPPPHPDAGPDRLIFKGSTNGSYSVKNAYQQLMSLKEPQISLTPTQVHQKKEIFTITWKKGWMVPRVRFFLWKLTQKALPLGKIIADRISKGDPVCQLCGTHDEDANHMIFHCAFARLCWFAGPIPIHTHHFQLDTVQNLVALSSATSDEDWTTAVNVMWAIWRSRNECMYESTIPTFDKFNNFLTSIQAETELFGTTNRKASLQKTQVIAPAEGMRKGWSCYTDGAWKERCKGGGAFVLKYDHLLEVYQAEELQVWSPLQAEAAAMLKAIHYVRNRGIEECAFYTDSEILVRTCTALGPPTEVDWRATVETFKIWELMRKLPKFTCCKIDRSQNDEADLLARRCRERGGVYEGHTYPLF